MSIEIGALDRTIDAIGGDVLVDGIVTACALCRAIGQYARTQQRRVACLLAIAVILLFR